MKDQDQSEVEGVINLCCISEVDGPEELITVSCVLDEDACAFTDALFSGESAKAQELFSTELQNHEEALEEANLLQDRIDPDLQDFLAISKTELNASLSGLKKPLPASHGAVMPYTADKEVYLHYPSSDLWQHKLIKFEPDDGNCSTIDLSDKISMRDSVI